MANEINEATGTNETNEINEVTEDNSRSILYRVIILYPDGEKAIRWYKNISPIIEKAGKLVPLSMGYIESVIVQKITSKLPFAISIIHALNGEEYKWIKKVESIAVFSQKQIAQPIVA